MFNVIKTRYDFEITNYLGSAQGSVTLVVEEDDISTQNSKDVVEITNGFESNPIDQEKFGEYVAGLYSLNNEAFEIQYTVCY